MTITVSPLYSSEDQLSIHRALLYAEHHAGTLPTATQENYPITQDLLNTTAELLMQLPARSEVVIAAILSTLPFPDIEREFGFDIARISSAVHETRRLNHITKNHPEDLRRELHHAFLDTIKDPRAALIKLAERLIESRDLADLEPQQQNDHAEETMRVYVPLARQMNLGLIERELSAIALTILPKWDYPRAQADSIIYEQEIAAKGYHQNQLEQCLLS